MSATAFVRAVRERVVVYDGAAGTGLQRLDLGPDDFGSPGLEGCNELLNVTRPDAVAALHASFLEVGVDVIETNTFGAFAVPLAEYGIAHRARELAAAGARIARETADGYATPDHPRWVAGSVGPGSKMPTLGHIGYAELRDAYQEMAAGLLEGGVDLFIVETMYDLLGLRAAVNGCRRAMGAAGRDVPLQVQVTIETTGRMLAGADIAAALAAIDGLRPQVVGINCATGPAEMHEPVRYLSRHARIPVSVIPNAGIPQVVDGEVRYGLTPDELADHHAAFITESGVTVVGGCCGTTPEHLAAVVERCRELVPARRVPQHEPGVSSIYGFTPFRQDASFLIIGERTNATGSKRFREAMLARDWDACVAVGRAQVAEAAHLIDLCVDYVGRDGIADMSELASRFATRVEAPVVLDSTEPGVLAAGLERFGGRSVLNSANLENGEEPGSRLDRTLSLAREHGAAVICLLVDEQGQARDVPWKLRVAHRLHDLAVNRYGLEPSDLFVDALTFPLGTGDHDLRGDAMATIEAIRRIKAEMPGVNTVLGVSNVSFGLRPAARQVLNSVFLHECLEAGLDAAIVHAGRIVPLNRIPEEQRRACEDLIYDRRTPGHDPLRRLMDLFADATTTVEEQDDRSGWTLERRLTQRIIDGDRDGLTDDLDEALAAGWDALGIINDVLLGGMTKVGDLFASGEMQLPFVMQSAETMKAAVGHLERHMEAGSSSSRGSIVLATVAGDVHDIGKNLVDIILSNNGYRVRNLGIKVGLTELLEVAAAEGADAVGMSGLLVKSTLVMRDNLEEMQRRAMDIPVLLGGAALTRQYVEHDLREVYEGPLFYCKDAFEGLRTLEQLVRRSTDGDAEARGSSEPGGDPLREGTVRARPSEPPPSRSPVVTVDNPLFPPPFWGSRVVHGLPIDQIAAHLNTTALFRHQWQFRPEAGESDADFRQRLAPLLAERLQEAEAEGLIEPRVAYGYFPAASEGNELIIYDDPDRTSERTRFGFPRQGAHPYLCIADFFRPTDRGETDTAAFAIVTMGPRFSQRAAELFAADRYTDYLLTHGLGVRMAEALAEYWHQRIRVEWGFGDEESPTPAGRLRRHYRGGRFSWGYAACPNLEDNLTVAELVEARRIGVDVGAHTGYQYHPEQTTSALICHHPQAKHFMI